MQAETIVVNSAQGSGTDFAPRAVRRSPLPGSGPQIIRAIAAAAVGLFLIGLAACGDDGDSDDAGTDGEAVQGEAADSDEGNEEDAGESDATPSEETTTTTVGPEEEVLEAFQQAQTAMEAAFEEADPDLPEFVAAFDGDALASYRDGIEGWREAGSGLVGGSDVAPEVVSVDSNEAVVRYCWSQETQEVDLETGDHIGSPVEENGYSEWQLARREDEWVVVEAQRLEEECDL